MTNEEALNIVNEVLIRGEVIPTAYEYPFWETIKFALEKQLKHGKWDSIDKWEHLFKCSICNKNYFLNLGNEDYNFCPNCGADMRGETDE